MKRFLIAGCGDVGTALGRRLHVEGHAVWGIRRRPECLPPCIHPIASDLTAPDLPERLPDSITDVVYVAGASERTDQAYAKAYVHGMDNLLNSLEKKQQPVRRIIFTSSTAVYGQSDGQWVDEASVANPNTFSGRRLLEAEGRLADSPYETIILRLAGIYGPSRSGLIKRLRQGEVRLPTTPKYANRVHRDDCVGMLHHLLDHPDPDPMYLGVDHDPADMRQVLRWLTNRLGVELLPEKPEEQGHPMRANKRCRNNRILQSGYVFLFPSYREGYGPIIGQQGPSVCHAEP